MPFREYFEGTVLMLGAGSDIGNRIAHRFAAEGSRVISTYFNTTNMRLPGLAMRCDIRDLAQIDDVFEVVKRNRPLKIVGFCALPFLEGDPYEKQGSDEILKFLAGHMHVMQEAKKLMTEGGRIFVISGQGVERGLWFSANYAAALSYMRTFGDSSNGHPEYGKSKMNPIQHLHLLYGAVETRELDGMSPEAIQNYKNKSAGFISPEEVASTVIEQMGKRIMPSVMKIDAYVGY